MKNSKLVSVPCDVLTWLLAQTKCFTWLLAHTEQGVIWGKSEANKWVTRTQIRPQYLLQVRLFCKNGELYAWRNGDGAWQAREILDDETDKPNDWIDEAHILWGNHTQGNETIAGVSFTLMSDGAQGLQHWVPLAVTDTKGEQRPLRLKVRHYLAEDETGCLRIEGSRLVDLVVV